MARLGEVFPNFDADTTEGRINFHQWIGDSWAILFSHPADFTPVCTTELARVVNLKPEFDKRGVKLIAISLDSVEDHKAWSKDVMHVSGATDCSRPLPYPIIADKSRELAVQLQMLDPNEIGKEGLPLPARTVFLIGRTRSSRCPSCTRPPLGAISTRFCALSTASS
ncbi:hypothetical protein BOX15_Mlig004483g4 [Macrostomum lignano]|uniref:Thioredoxin domain-containing protein n=2 Tax=Macrostomum lignano TaxID=282301 RepID=A0A267DX59_9PLAT|nr:hypothetical protein BOX15_Mlig004483g4 [Macrostomum lignano]